jgi:hypothetical protein
MIKIRLRYQRQDFIDAYRVNFRSQSKPKWQYFWVLCCIFFLIAIIIAALKGNAFSVILCMLLAAFYGRDGFAEFVAIPLMVSQVFNPAEKQLNQEFLLIFDDDKIIEKTKYKNLEIKLIYRHVITPDLLLIFYHPTSFIFLPKKYCANQGQFREICEQIIRLPHGDMSFDFDFDE